MSKKTKLIPELRFPEFVDEGKWEEKVLSKISNAIFDGTHQTPNYIENGIPFFSVENLVSGNKNKFISRKDYKIATNKNKPEKGDILITRIGKIGFSAIVEWDYEFSIYVTLACIKSSKHFNSYYLHSYFQSSAYQKEILSKSLLNAVPCKINMNELRETKVLLPNLKEQQKIASCLSSLDEVLAAESQKLDLLKDHKKGLMQKLFPQEGEKVPKYRFKEFEKDGEWVEKKIIETTDKKIKWSFTGGPFGSNLKASDYTTEGIRIIQLQNIGDGEFNNEYKIYTSKEKADELLSCNIYSDEIILSKMGDPVGRACIIPSYLNRCVMASDGIRLVVDEKKYSKYFIYSIINSKQIRKAIEKKSTGSTRKRIGLDELKGIELMIPKTIKEQQKIASCLSSLDALITAQTEKIEQLKLNKKGLMQGLFPKIND